MVNQFWLIGMETKAFHQPHYTRTIPAQSQQYKIVLLHARYKLRRVPLFYSHTIEQSSCNTSIFSLYPNCKSNAQRLGVQKSDTNLIDVLQLTITYNYTLPASKPQSIVANCQLLQLSAGLRVSRNTQLVSWPQQLQTYNYLCVYHKYGCWFSWGLNFRGLHGFQPQKLMKCNIHSVCYTTSCLSFQNHGNLTLENNHLATW